MKVRRSTAKEERSFTKRRKLPGLKGHGPRHADANTDTVPAMLTPREAVLNRNAAELAGRGNIEALNAQGNQLAKKGVDLAGGKSMKEKKQKLAEGGYAGDWQGGPLKRKQPGYLGPPESMPGLGTDQGNVSGGGPNAFGGYAQNVNQWGNPYGWERQREGGNWQGGPLPRPMPIEPGAGGGAPPFAGGGGYQNVNAQGNPYGWNPNPNVVPGGAVPGGGFYPPDQGPFGMKPKKPLGMQSGSTEVQPIGTPAGGQVYGPPIQLSAPDILSKLQAAGKEQGLSSAQINGLMNAFKGGSQAFNTGGYGEGSATSQALGPALEQAFPGGYQGGISDIGYPPFVAPSADYHGDKGGWQGRYDPNYFIPNYG